MSIKLSTDSTFHFELLRALGAAPGRGSDIGEVLQLASEVNPGDFESWFAHCGELAERVAASVDAAADAHPVSVRNGMFRAATYFRMADFFLHGDPTDPRIARTWDRATACFNRAISLLPIPGQRVDIAAEDFLIPAILYVPSSVVERRRTLLLFNGFDGSQEEMLHNVGFAALERGWNVLTFEGPGQPTVLSREGKGFINEWEAVVGPVVDHALELPIVAPNRLVLYGNSFGGYLAPRAACFEHRLAALVCVDGIFDVHEAFLQALPDSARQLLSSGDYDGFDAELSRLMAHNSQLRWAIEHGLWAFRAKNARDFLEKASVMTLNQLTDKITCPTLVCDAENERFFPGQARKLADATSKVSTYHLLTSRDAAGEHCHVGAQDVINRVVFDWLDQHLA